MVCIATCYSWIVWGANPAKGNSSYLETYRQALGPTLPPVQRIPESFPEGGV